jgi:hypothetical protein
MQQPQKATKAGNENFWGTQWRLKWNEEKSCNGISRTAIIATPGTALTEFVLILADL